MKIGAMSAVLAATGAAQAQLRVVEWNITSWTAGNSRVSAFQTAIYAQVPAGLTLAGESMSPDILSVQEINQGGSGGAANAASFLTMLNSAPGSPGDWAMAPYVNNSGTGGGEGNALYYRTSKIDYLDVVTLNAGTGSGATNPPRDNQRWRVRVKGYASPAAELYIYGAHFKAAAGGENEARRTPEANRIRTNSNALPAGAHFLLTADFNFQDSFEPAAIALGATPNAGRFNDPIIKPGNWENQASFRNIHTQEPASQMDSRHDQILISDTLRDGVGLSYLPAQAGGNIMSPFRSAGDTGQEWNDPNHSYRCWGNDGQSFNQPIRTSANTQVGSAIAQALITSVASGGHLPVYLDLQVPAKLGAPTAPIAFGTVAQNAVASQTLSVTNGANIIFSRDSTGWGIEPLGYSLSVTGPFSIQGSSGPFTRAATALPAQANTHTIVMNTSTTGMKTGTLTITSNDPDVPTRVINLTGEVGSSGPPTGNFDVNMDGVINVEDMYAWYGAGPAKDVNGDAVVNQADVELLRAFLRYEEAADVTSGRR